VAEELTLASLEVVGRLPQDFPAGVYVRNGPNPRFPPVTAAGRFGLSAHHWFEGDAMLHAVEFDGKGGATYRNRYVRTKHLEQELAAGRRLFRPVMDVAPGAMLANAVCNAARTGGDFFKSVANTAVVPHAGRLLCLYESSPPVQVDPHSLETIGPLRLEGPGSDARVPLRSFTAHPKLDPATGELVFFGYSVERPFCTVGVLDAGGELVASAAPGGFEVSSLMHDFALTKHYVLLLDFALTQDPDRVGRGEPIFEWEGGRRPCRIGVLSRADLASEVRWFSVEPCYAFHVVNAYEEPAGHIVVRGMACRTGDVLALTQNFGEGWPDVVFKRGSAYHNRLREWSLDLQSGQVQERELSGDEVWPEFPVVHPSFQGSQHRFAYSVDIDVERSNQAAGTLVGALLKWDFADGQVRVHAHRLEPGLAGGEGTFVPRPGASREDDGWLLFFAYDERAGSSELRLLDCSSPEAFEGPPCARIPLPCRVPFGFHGCFAADGGQGPQAQAPRG